MSGDPAKYSNYEVKFPQRRPSGKGTEPVTGWGSSFTSECERNSISNFFKLVPIWSGYSKWSRLAFWHLPCSYVFARGNCILLGGSFYSFFHVFWGFLGGYFSGQDNTNPKSYQEIPPRGAGSHKWPKFSEIQNVVVRCEYWWIGPVGMLPLLAGGKGGELHQCLWNTPTFVMMLSDVRLFCSLYLKQNEKPQGDFLLAINPMPPKPAEILILLQYDQLNDRKQGIMGHAGSYTTKEELRC